MSRVQVPTREIDGKTQYWCENCELWVAEEGTHIWNGTGYPYRLCRSCDQTFDTDPYGDWEFENQSAANGDLQQ